MSGLRNFICLFIYLFYFRPEDRPTFSELSAMLRDIHNYMQKEEGQPHLHKEEVQPHKDEVRSPPMCPPRRPIPPPKNN